MTNLIVDAPAGRWITIAVDAPTTYLRVTQEGRLVASAGMRVNTAPSPTDDTEPSVTFQQVRRGRVTYAVGVSHMGATPGNTVPYSATARLAGAAFDREGECGVTPGLALDAVEPERTLTLSVRLVSTPADASAARAAGQRLTEIYRAIGIATRISYDRVAVPQGENDQFVLIDIVRRRYGGVRPRGVDVVHLLTDNFIGGYALCIGGVALPEYAFSVGSLRYTEAGGLPVPVEAGVIAAHEIGHLLGGHHHQSNCAEAPPSGTCTVMFPLAAGVSGVFSTLERNTVRQFTRTHARG